MISLKGPIALLFPGQGVQKPGMGKSLYDRYPAARRAFERAEAVLDMPVRRLCFDGPVEELNRTEVIQPCVMTVCWAAYEVWRESYGFANRNADVQFVLSGQIPAVQESERLALEAGARRALILTIPLPAHTPLMEKAAAAFRQAVDRLQFRAPSIPILANASGEAMRTV